MTPTVSQTSKQWTPYIIFGLGTLAGSTGPIILRMIQAEGIPSPIITAFRLVIASLVLTPFILSRYKNEIAQLSRRDVLVAITAGALFAIQFTLNFESYRFTSILVAGVISGIIPLWTAVLERVVLRTRFPKVVWVGLALVVIGGILIGLSKGGAAPSIQENILLGGGIGLASTIVGAIYLIIGRSLRSHMPFIPYLWLVFLSAAVTAVITAMVGGFSFTGYSANGYFWLLMGTLFPQLIAHGAFNYILAYLPATLISIAVQLVTVISAIAAFLVFQELPGPLQLVGSGIILVGVISAIIAQSRSKNPHG